jgi:ATP-dependent helicase/nuclease subunit B
MAPRLYTIGAGIPFADALARGIIERVTADPSPLALADVELYLPTRRAARTLEDAFADALQGAALLPQLRALGDVDTEVLAFEPDVESLAPAIAPLRRRLLLATMVQRWRAARHGATLPFAQAAQLGAALGSFLDEARTQEVDLARLETLVPDALAQHWAEIRDFLNLVRDAWPAIAAEEGALDPAVRRRQWLDQLAEHYRSRPPGAPVIIAGTTGSIPATARLLLAVANRPDGFVVLPGLDRELDAESWDALDPGHPQYGLKELLRRLGVGRDAVLEWQPARPAARQTLLSLALRPAPTTDAWRAVAEEGTDRVRQGLAGLSLIEASHEGEEARIVALILREVLETPDRHAALVTPDRNLARRVAAELGRWDIRIDDSAGKPLSRTQAGNFLLLLLGAVSENLAPVALLALLKHPLAAGGEETASFRRRVRLLDRMCLRGPRPDPGLAGLRRAIGGMEAAPQRTELAPLLAALERALAPFTACFAQPRAALSALATHLAEAAEALAASDSETGANRLWRGEAGRVAAELLAALARDAQGLPEIEPAAFPGLFQSFCEAAAVRAPFGGHPRLAILGPLEARLQRFDTVVLGGLNDGTWPRSVAADPWLSRPMREMLGFESPERAIGLAAHDFWMLASAPRVFLTRAQKADGSPAIKSRWLERLLQLVTGLGFGEALKPDFPWLSVASRLERPEHVAPQSRPAPCPPVAARPRALSVTEIETWLRDPYAIYAKYVLRLRPLDVIDAAIDAPERGVAIHRILELYLREPVESDPAMAERRLIAIADQVFSESAIPAGALAVWRPRFVKAARWFVAREIAWRPRILRSHLELAGACTFQGPAGAFALRARADRIDILNDGSAAIIDYKTGSTPTAAQVKKLLSPQLPLEAAMLAAGGFSDAGIRQASHLIYLRLSGGTEPGEEIAIPNAAALSEEVKAKLSNRIADFDHPDTPYLSRIMPFRTTSAGDYDHLARVREWLLSDTEAEL